MTTGVDYAWGWPGDPQGNAAFIHALKAGGYEFVFRYFSHDDGKDLHPEEAQALSDAGLWIGTVWETTEQRPLDGHDAGVQDARDALVKARACRMPDTAAIYAAVDFDANPPDVEDYFRGFGEVLGAARVGVYGSYRVVRHLRQLGLAPWGWQADAWSYGQWDTDAHVHQGAQKTIGGVDCDVNTTDKANFGQWRIGVSPQLDQEDNVQFGQLAEGPQAITPIALPKGRFKTIGFTCDNGLQKLPPAKLRVAIDHGGGNWSVAHIEVDSTKGQSVITFSDPANTDGISVQREDAGDVHVAYEVS